jgi:hypothetical protein
MAESTANPSSSGSPQTKAAKEPTIFVTATQRTFGFRVGPDTPGTKDGKLMFETGKVTEVPQRYADTIAGYHGTWLASYKTKADAEKAIGIAKEKAEKEAAK